MTSVLSRISIRRPITSYSKVQIFLSNIIRNRGLQVDKAVTNKEYLDVGCGPNTHKNFINLDYGWRPDIDLCWDITKGLPLKDTSLKGIFSEHCLEHLPFTSVDLVLGDFYRILKPGGNIRVVVPDGELYLTRYTDIISNRESEVLPYSSSDHYQGLYSPIMSVNRIFRAHGHLFIYDFMTFEILLKKNGFTDIKKETYSSGRDPVLLIDTKSRAIESLYVEATKPITSS